MTTKYPLILTTALTLAFPFSVHASLSCQSILNKIQQSPYTLAEVEQEFHTTVTKYHGDHKPDFYDSLLSPRNSTEVDAILIEGINFNRIRITPPPSQKEIVIHPPTDLVRDRFFQKWGRKKISLPEVSISRISDKALKDTYGFYLAELSNGQLVFVTDPFPTTSHKGISKVHYDESDLIEYELFKVGLTPFLALGKDSNGRHRLVRPVFKGYSESLPDLHLEKDFTVFSAQLDALKRTELPFFSQFFHPEVTKAINYYVSSTVQLGRYDSANNLSIVGLSRAGLKSWELDLETRDKMTVPAQLRSADHFISVHDIYKGRILANTSMEFRIAHANDLYQKAKLYDALTTVYIDLLISYSFGGTQKAWRESNFEARVDEDTSITPTAWKNSRSLKTHFKKHGQKEMGLETPEEYLQLAVEFFESTDKPAILIKRQEDNGYFKYNFETREFGVLSPDLKIITYYQIDNSHRPLIELQDYLAEQIGR
ncbi:MAG: hypothetical protein ACRBBP_09215 [Bdellovibrionales bacterium]